MAELDRPSPPGDYQVVVVGSGPGGLQMSYALGRAGIRHAAISADPAPGGVFRRFPVFQRLITWTKPYAPVPRGIPAYQWYDWNSMLSDEPDLADLVVMFMDGTSYFPSRPEMERGLVTFAERARLPFRYDCRWESTTREGDGFVLTTSDGEYRCDVAIFAVGTTEAWRPDIPGMDLVPHYVDTADVSRYEDRSVFIVGKRNSGFELADGLLPRARSIVLASPRPARLSVITRSLVGARARYAQPFEDHILGGGTFVLDAAIERIERRDGGGYRVHTQGTTRPGARIFDVDEVIAATGFGTPLGDLPDLGVATFHQGRLPAQTPYWESPSAPGIFFAGSVTQGSIGLKKYGLTANSAAVHGFRYNAGVLARYLARERFGIEVERPALKVDEVVPMLLEQATRGPALWHQPAYLARVVEIDGGAVDAGVVPLAHFLDAGGPDAAAMTLEHSPEGEARPCVYVRRGGTVTEMVLSGDEMLDFQGGQHRHELAEALRGLVPS